MLKFRCVLLALICVFIFCGCSPKTVTDPSDTCFSIATQPRDTFLPTESSGPLLAKDYLGTHLADFGGDDVADYEVIIPENGVLILTGEESMEEVFIDGEVYITYNADVSFHNVYVTGKVYCHGVLRGSGLALYSVFTYYDSFLGGMICSAYDGMHGQFLGAPGSHGGGAAVGNELLDYAFEKWGNYGPVVEQSELIVSQNPIEPQVVQHGDTTNYFPNVYIFTGSGLVSNKRIEGDVYITSDAVVEFQGVEVAGNIYCYGQLKLSLDKRYDAHRLSKYNRADAIYAYSFHESCDSFDGVHGLVTGGPVICDKIVIADDALDYAFETFGKQ